MGSTYTMLIRSDFERDEAWMCEAIKWLERVCGNCQYIRKDLHLLIERGLTDGSYCMRKCMEDVGEGHTKVCDDHLKVLGNDGREDEDKTCGQEQADGEDGDEGNGWYEDDMGFWRWRWLAWAIGNEITTSCRSLKVCVNSTYCSDLVSP